MFKFDVCRYNPENLCEVNIEKYLRKDFSEVKDGRETRITMQWSGFDEYLTFSGAIKSVDFKKIAKYLNMSSYFVFFREGPMASLRGRGIS